MGGQNKKPERAGRGQGNANRLGSTVQPILVPCKGVSSLVHLGRICFFYVSRVNSRPWAGRSSNQYNLVAPGMRSEHTSGTLLPEHRVPRPWAWISHAPDAQGCRHLFSHRGHYRRASPEGYAGIPRYCSQKSAEREHP